MTQLARLPEATRVFAGHEYLARNLEFTLDREPDNTAARSLLDAAREQAPESMQITTLAEEKRINTFFRLQSPTVIAKLRAGVPRHRRAARRAHRVPEAAGAEEQVVTGAAQRVLYVDDEPTLVFLITRALEKLGIACRGFASADEALAAFRAASRRPSLSS